MMNLFRLTETIALLVLTAGVATSPALAQEDKDLLPGLIGEYYTFDRELVDFPTLGDMKPNVRRVDPRIDFLPSGSDFADTGITSAYYARWTGERRDQQSSLTLPRRCGVEAATH